MLPVFLAMAQSQNQDEIRLILERYLPHLDVSRCKLAPERLVVPVQRDRQHDRPIGRPIPNADMLPKEGVLAPRMYQLLAAVVVSTGRVDYAPGTDIEVRVPTRQIGELCGISHQRVCQLVSGQGERSQV